MISLIGAITFDPTIRGILVMVVALTVLPGSILLILSTNLGFRLGTLVALTGLFGWLTCMGVIWWVYGLGIKGRDPSWVAQEVNLDRDKDTLTKQVSTLPRQEDLPDPLEFLNRYPKVKAEAMKDPAFATLVNSYGTQHRLTLTKVISLDPSIRADLDEELGGWRILSEQDTRRGETTAASDAVLISPTTQTETGFTSTADYFVEDVFYFGGKEAAEPVLPGEEKPALEQAWTRVASIFEFKNPELYSVVTVKQAKTFPADPSKPPPPNQPRTDVDSISVIQLRNLGNKRLFPAYFAIASAVIFLALVFILYQREQTQRRLVEAYEKER